MCVSIPRASFKCNDHSRDSCARDRPIAARSRVTVTSGANHAAIGILTSRTSLGHTYMYLDHAANKDVTRTIGPYNRVSKKIPEDNSRVLARARVCIARGSSGVRYCAEKPNIPGVTKRTSIKHTSPCDLQVNPPISTHELARLSRYLSAESKIT